MVLFSRRLPSLLRVPASPVPRSRQYYECATTSHSRISGRLLLRFRRPHDPSCSCPAYALLQARRSLAGRGLVVAGCPAPASHAWTRVGSLRSSGDPSDAFAPFRDPGRAEMSSPLTGTSVLPSPPTQRRPQRLFHFGANPQLWHLLPTLHAWRCRTRARLASGRRAAPLPGGS